MVRGVDFRYANLQGAFLNSAQLWGSKLAGVKLEGSFLQCSDIESVVTLGIVDIVTNKDIKINPLKHETVGAKAISSCSSSIDIQVLCP